MGTSNFYTKNAYNTYAVLMNYEQSILDEDGNETDETETIAPEYWEVEEFIDDIRTQAEALAVGNKFKYYKELEMKDPHSLRSYESTELFQLYHQKSFGDVDVQVNINCVARHAYYEGASLDWFLTCTFAGETNLIEDTDYEIEDNMTYMNTGLRKIQSRNAENWVEKIKDSLINAVEKLFTENSTPLVVTARFSNGETHYAKIK
jgi:hypothetical protein